ncbi:acetyl esterase [Thermomonospora echinospora]|uniref:Acetyl esterase n=1 Tax=Thermomonospora echinospora TaxID=1992 RepID=A0A1H6E4N5_9ACTN|nr:alpha/beta hydrolase [Thermomonospora echinospora]SEG92738.1 acetyl esterase [Thermomonospora echinospora]
MPVPTRRRIPQLDPDARALRDAFEKQGRRPMREIGVEAMRKVLEDVPHPSGLPEMATAEEHLLNGPHGPFRLTVHSPSAAGELPGIVYFHGGGMVLGSNHSFEPLARNMAHHTGARVVAVEYHLAPEFPPPAQLDDAWFATRWVAEHAGELGILPDRLCVAGDSAGGTLAAGVCLMARDRGGPRIFCQILVYPGVDRDLGAASISEFSDAFGLGRDDVLFLHEVARAGGPEPTSPYQVPAYADDLTGLPPAIIAVGELDPIRDWAERYAERLRDAGVQTTITRYPGAYHGFLLRMDFVARGRLAMAEIAGILRAKFAHPLPW